MMTKGGLKLIVNNTISLKLLILKKTRNSVICTKIKRTKCSFQIEESIIILTAAVDQIISMNRKSTGQIILK